MRNWNHKVVITVLSFIASVGGIIEIIYIANMNIERGFPTTRLLLMSLFHNVEFSFIDSDVLGMWVGDSLINMANLLFYVLLLVGALLFLANGFKNARIVGFCFAIILISHALSLAYSIYIFSTKFSEIAKSDQPYWVIIFFITNMLWSWFSYYVLRTIYQHRKLAVDEFEEDGVKRAAFNIAGKGKRIVHLIVDRLMIILIGFNWVLYFRETIEDIEDSMGTRLTIILLMALGELMYFCFFEGIFAATPAKYLTATRVGDEYGNKPRFGIIVKRSLSRLIPFDALSFLFSNGWHDSISDTYVLNDKIVEDESVFSFEEKMQ